MTETDSVTERGLCLYVCVNCFATLEFFRDTRETIIVSRESRETISNPAKEFNSFARPTKELIKERIPWRQ